MDPFQIVGSVLADRYRIDAAVGERRFDVTYRATDIGAQWPVAIQLLKTPAGLSDARLRSVLDTLDALRQLSKEHPAFEQIVESRTLRQHDRETPYLVLEWLEGTSLEAAIRFEQSAGRIAQLEDVLTVLDPIAQALAVAHARGMAHGDIGPSNVLLVGAPDQPAVARLLGFGRAQAASADTQTVPSARADVYAMASLCRELLSGRPLSDRPAVEQVFHRALAPLPDQRYADMRQFWQALHAASAGVIPPPAGIPLPPIYTANPRSSRVAYFVAAALVPVAVVVFVLIATSGPSKKKHARNDDHDDDDQPLRRTSSSVVVTTPPTPPTPSTFIMRPRPPPLSRRCPTDMVDIPAGTFAMGSTADVDEGPVHDVTVSAFCMDRTEVTVGAYKACVTAGNCTIGSLKEYSIDGSGGFSEHCNWDQAGKDNHPINCVSWKQATDYCLYRSKRLPTEEEWEYAARGGDENRKYPWGAAAPAGQMCWNGPGNDAGDSKRAGTCEVGKYKAGESRWGVMDMGGNVWEWTASNYCPYTPTGKQSCTNTALVARGACWSCYLPIDGRASDRLVDQPADRFDALGFRCASSAGKP